MLSMYYYYVLYDMYIIAAVYIVKKMNHRLLCIDSDYENNNILLLLDLYKSNVKHFFKSILL